VETKNKVILATFDPTKINWKFSVKQSNRRMKLYIKMSQAETTQWDELRKAAKPPEMNDNEFAKILFYRGIDAFMSQMTDMINNMSDEDKAKAFEDAGVVAPEKEEEPTREELAALGKMDSETSKEEDA
tara:strand:+ start:1947 stop:2333 length:387 start_codon:yes stop_codon:yes gene_type:complete